MRTAALALIGAALILACSNKPKDEPAPAPTVVAAPADDGHEPELSPEPVTLTYQLPPGWTAVPAAELPPFLPGAFFNDARTSEIVIRHLVTENRTPLGQVTAICKIIERETQGSASVAPVVAASDGRSAHCDITMGEDMARMTILHLGAGGQTQLAVTTHWAKASAADAAAAAEILKSLAVTP